MLVILNLNRQIEPKIIDNFINISKSSIIHLKIYGTGKQSIFYKDYKSKPNKIYINGLKQNTTNYEYTFDQEDNNVELIWNNQISDLSNMFLNCSKIYEFNFTYFDVSNINGI